MQGDSEKQFKSRSRVRYNNDAFIEESGHREAAPFVTSRGAAPTGYGQTWGLGVNHESTGGSVDMQKGVLGVYRYL